MYRQRGKRNGILPFDQSIGEADRRSLSGACSRQIHTTRLRPQRVGVGETRSREGEHHCKLKFHFTIHCYEIDVLPRTKPARWTSCPYLISRPQVEITWFTTQEPFSQALTDQIKDGKSTVDPFAEADRLEAYTLHKKAPKDKDSEEMAKVNLFQVNVNSQRTNKRA